MTAIGRRVARLEHRLTQPNATLGDLESAVALALASNCAALTVNPWLVRAAKRALGRSRMRLGTVIGYPHGTQVLAVKAFEASKGLEQGATQLDFVMNGGALLSGDDEIVVNDMLAVIDMAHSALAVAGVIIEAQPLSDELVRRACRLAERAGADLVVTSTGEATARRTIKQAALLRDSVGPRIAVKASGRFRTLPDLRSAASAGAAWISAPFSPELARAAVGTFDEIAGPLPGRSAATALDPGGRTPVASRAG
jgi:deoxyribose-phosphate aldolase